MIVEINVFSSSVKLHYCGWAISGNLHAIGFAATMRLLSNYFDLLSFLTAADTTGACDVIRGGRAMTRPCLLEVAAVVAVAWLGLGVGVALACYSYRASSCHTLTAPATRTRPASPTPASLSVCSVSLPSRPVNFGNVKRC